MADGYKNFCKIVGEGAMEYTYFDFWWHRFANGKFDLSYDRSLDPPTRKFLNLPIDILEKVLKKLKYGERSIFRNVSKACRQTVDSLNYTFKKVVFRVIRNFVGLKIENRIVQYFRKYCTWKPEANEEPWSMEQGFWRVQACFQKFEKIEFKNFISFIHKINKMLSLLIHSNHWDTNLT